MSLPSLDELLARRNTKKKILKDTFKEKDVSKIFFKEKEKILEKFICDHFVMLEKQDQELAHRIRRNCVRASWACTIPSLSLGLYTYIKKPTFAWYVKFPLWASVIIFPAILGITYNSERSTWINMYLIDKYEDRYDNYVLTHNPKSLSADYPDNITIS
ncbi:hypothetical protein SteCoe_14842 [Stentor coeruleus]|uniref:Transmembrane protein n=1 Tax=Stentor coeruleus TaxID=5963 RepID=A0A1R2C4Z0_9CILI|nr:hypothetical protein SteCoe_14842 [Stentor coeruleus]